MTDTPSSLLAPEQMQRLINASHPDVFAILGMQQHPAQKALLVRAFLPGAKSVVVIDKKSGKSVGGLALVHEAGVFEGKAGRRRKRFDYCLQVDWGEQQQTIDDPYRFASLISEDDLYLFCEGTHQGTFQWMGANHRVVSGSNADTSGMLFVLWAPDAARVSVVGDFNLWDGRRHMMRKHPGAGIWEIFIPDVGANQHYKYEVLTQAGELLPLKADPYAKAMQRPPQTSSLTPVVTDYHWQDQQWMAQRQSLDSTTKAVSIYEVHIGSWRRVAEADGSERFLTYRELACELIPYVQDMGFSHIQLMPISEFPFDGSWGYQPVGLFAPTSRFGSAEDFKYFVDCCHQQGIGVLFDWVPGHFPSDAHGIGKLDGTCAYEHLDERKGFHPQWNTLIYNYGRNEVHSYLLSNAHYWLSEFHLDGLRVDAVSSMLYLDYAREPGQWIPNQHGGHENLEAVALLQKVNYTVAEQFPGTLMVAEESTAWPGVTHAVDQSGLGFGYKWNMGWMHDTLQYMQRDSVHRKFHHGEMTFGLEYGYNEHYVLPLSHDEVVHGKGSLLAKMTGDDWQQFANLRAYFGFMWTHPGKKLLFMGGEFAQRQEWNHDHSLDWHLLAQPAHRGVQNLIRDLNRLYRQLPALSELDHDANGFQWLLADNAEQSIFAYLRKGNESESLVLVVVNMTPQYYTDYLIGVPRAGFYQEQLNTDSDLYGGSNKGNLGGVHSHCHALHGQPYSVALTIAPLATMIFSWQP